MLARGLKGIYTVIRNIRRGLISVARGVSMGLKGTEKVLKGAGNYSDVETSSSQTLNPN